MSTESIASSPLSAGAAESCGGCAAPLAGDQRYCLECGQRRAPLRSALLFGSPLGDAPLAGGGGSGSAPPPAPPSPPPGRAGDARREPQGSAVTVIAGVGVLLLAMGVGVLIGRSGGSPSRAGAPQVISVASTPAAGSSAAGSSEAAFSDDWPAGTSGYAVQLQTLPQAGTQPNAVQTAKAAATAKGAKAVGALKSEDFTSLSAGSYIVYSGVFHKQAEAEKALAGLRKDFPGAKVIAVNNGASTSGAASRESSAPAGGASGAGSSLSHPAPPTVVQKLNKQKGKNYEQESKNLPNVISTG